MRIRSNKKEMKRNSVCYLCNLSYLPFNLHSLWILPMPRKYAIINNPIEMSLMWFSYVYNIDKAEALTPPKIVIIEKPIELQLIQIPELIPNNDPNTPILVFLLSFLIFKIWNIAMFVTRDDKKDIKIIVIRLNSMCNGIWKANMGSKNKNWLVENNKINKETKIPINSKRYKKFENMYTSVFFCDLTSNMFIF